MQTMNDILDKAAQAPDGYEKDGLIHCPECHTPRQCVVTHPFTGAEQKVTCLCRCQAEARDRENARLENGNRVRELDRRRRDCFRGAERYAKCRFDLPNTELTPQVANLRKYAERFETAYEKGHGFMLFGGIGTGKSYAAACVANLLLDMGYRVRMTNLPRLVAEVQRDAFKTDRIEELNRYDLLILDDLGVERKTGYMDEAVYSIVDSRYLSMKPMLFTTNLTPEQLRNPEDTEVARVYSRVQHVCPLMEFKGADRRKDGACYADMRELLNG